MKNVPHPLIIGNWKMNPQSVSLSTKLAKDIKTYLTKKYSAEIVIAPPSIYLEGVKKIANGTRLFKIGAQNVHSEKLGAYTGEISLPMLRDVGVTYVILGHSERREMGETDLHINHKIHATLKAGIVPILCIGEKIRDDGGSHFTHIEQQMRNGLKDISRAKLENVVIAYEPVWAIGTGNNASPEDIHEMCLFIEKVLSDMYGRNYASKVRIIYGGSVSEKNAKDIFTRAPIDGFLVGGASLHPREFVHIIKAVST